MTRANRPTPLQNRVTPFSEIVAVPERGTLMGNRGSLHDAQQRLTPRRWATRRWITCLLEFRGRHREVMQPGRYTELFFLDEVTAFAAGHRPCAECRRDNYNRFREAWAAGHGLRRLPSAGEMDELLHRERVDDARRQRTWKSTLKDLPSGVMVSTEREVGAEAWLWYDDRVWRWSPGGYQPVGAAATAEVVEVLTPRSVTLAFAWGYVPAVHESITSAQ